MDRRCYNNGVNEGTAGDLGEHCGATWGHGGARGAYEEQINPWKRDLRNNTRSNEPYTFKAKQKK